MPKPSQNKVDNVLILQGDWEGGLANFGVDLIAAGKKVTKVVLHAGDWIYHYKRVPTVSYKGKIDQWESWLRAYIADHDIDTLVIYNQYRPYNVVGWNLAKELKLECLVLELGLIRPDFCSLYSRDCDQFKYLANEWDKLLTSGGTLKPPVKPPQLRRMSTPKKMTQFALFFLLSRLMSIVFRRYPHYVDQRTMGVWHHLKAGFVGMVRFYRRNKEHKFEKDFEGEWSGNYYFVPLQVHTDSQITERSDFSSVEEFIKLVITSFYDHAPAETKLVFKVHPMDRGYKDYQAYIDELRQSNPHGQRVFYLDRIHLPTALDHARACVTINSSVGLSALIHHTPLLTLGKASFDLEGLTYKGELDDFWENHGKVNEKNVDNYISLLKHTSQAKGTLYQRLYDTPGRCRIQWPTIFTKVLFNQEPNI